MIAIRTVRMLFSVAIGVSLFADADVASANLSQWELRNMTFQDGGTASGSLLFDADAPGFGQLVDYDITLAGSSPAWPFPTYRYTPQTSWGGNEAHSATPANLIFFSNQIFNDRFGRNNLSLFLGFTPPTSDVGGIVVLRAVLKGEEEGFDGSHVKFSYDGLRRDATGGYLVAIPEPCEALLFAAGLAALVSFRIAKGSGLLRTLSPGIQRRRLSRARIRTPN